MCPSDGTARSELSTVVLAIALLAGWFRLWLVPLGMVIEFTRDLVTDCGHRGEAIVKCSLIAH